MLEGSVQNKKEVGKGSGRSVGEFEENEDGVKYFEGKIINGGENEIFEQNAGDQTDR